MRITIVELSEKEKEMGLLVVTASVEMILFSYSNEDTNDEERRKTKLGCRETTKCGIRRQH